MATRISIFNQKGGVAKSATVANIGAVFAAAGNRVLIVDADPQGNISGEFIGVDFADRLPESDTLAAIFSPEPPFLSDLLRHSKFENIDIVPSNEYLAHRAVPIASAGLDVLQLRNGLDLVDENYDVILIDNGPSLSSISWSTLLAAEYVIIPTTPERLSVHGINKIHRTIDAARQSNPALQIMGYVLTQVSPRQLAHRAVIDMLRKEFGNLVFDTEINTDVTHREASIREMPVTYYAARSKAAKSYEALTQEIYDRHQQTQARKAA